MTSEVTTCFTTDPLQRAAQIMWDCDCGAVPVVDHEGRAVGLVTDRDLCMAAYTRGLSLSAMGVSSLLSALYVCSATTSIDEAISLMRAHRIRRLVVVEPNDCKVVGMLALADVARHLMSLAPNHGQAAVMLSELLVSLSERRLDTPEASTKSGASPVHNAAE